MKLTKREYEVLIMFLAAAKGNKELDEVANRFMDYTLVDIKSACEKIIKAVENPQ